MLRGIGDFFFGIAPFRADGDDGVAGPHVVAGFRQGRRFLFIRDDEARVGIGVDELRKAHDRRYLRHVVAAALLGRFQGQALPAFEPCLPPFII